MWRTLFITGMGIMVCMNLVVPRKAEAADAVNDWAQASTDTLIERYWNPNIKMFNTADPCRNCNTTFHYWWEAHGIDALLDAFERTGDTKYTEMVAQMYDGLRMRNGGHLFNDFYDDEEWMALALLRAHTLTGENEYMIAAQRLWDDIKDGWNDYLGGGISWRKSQRNYKNAPANGPAAILAARLYMLNKDPKDLEWAEKITAWLREHLVDPASGIVWDGINRQGDNQLDNHWLFTYNQGTYVGACVELWRATGKQEYLADAHRTATAALVQLTDSDGIFKEDGQGDGGLFKGILVRYLVQLYKADQTATYIIDSLQKNAASAWQARTATGINGPRWKAPKAFGTVDLSTQLSAVMLYNLLAQLQGQ